MSVGENFNRGIRFREFLTRNTHTVVRSRTAVRSTDVPDDGYRLRVSADGRAEIVYANARGKRYAEETLASWTKDGETLVAEAEDYPSFPLRGMIEGFYGEPYSWDRRRDVVAFLAEHRMNAYFYAPKDDEYHRARWRELYPQETLEQIARLKRYADEKDVFFYYCLAPGLDFRYTLEEDYSLITAKLDQLSAVGIDRFAILFDDIEPKLSPQDALRFSCPAEAHCHLANFLDAGVKHKGPLLFCPTDYSQNTDTAYRRTVREKLNPDIGVFWTGYNCAAEAIPERDCGAAREYFAHPLLLWDNYPVNDFEPKTRIYLGAVCNRTRKIAQYHIGALANPSALWESSKFALSSMAEWMWNAEDYDEEGAYLRAVREHLGGTKEDLFFADLNRSSVLRVYPVLKGYFEREDWAYLDGYYRRYERAVCRVQATCRKELKAEWKELFRYCTAECSLYRAIRSGGETGEILSEMQGCAYRTADQSILFYIKEKYGIDITVAERTVYWDTDRKEND